MGKPILLAVQFEMRDWFLSIIPKADYEVIYTKSRDEKMNHLDRFEIAIIDENFDGPDTGWLLAEKVRQKSPRTKIILLVRSSSPRFYEALGEKCDWIMRFPLSAEQVLHELERKRSILD